MRDSAIFSPTSNTIQATPPAVQVLGVLSADIGQVFVSLMRDDDGATYFNLAFESAGEMVDLGLNPAAAYGFAALICDPAVNFAPPSTQDAR
ncbi:hypothetical protein PV646_28655 [Streptomyces sp. ID05-26A]|nr:hypothetical protein [Streptomyces sp. ID05-26A]